MESKLFKTEETDLGTKILFKDKVLYHSLPKPVFMLFERPMIGVFYVPFTSFKVSFVSSETEYNMVLDKNFANKTDIEEVDPETFAIPYPCTGAIKVDLTKGVTFHIKDEKTKESLLKKMDKAVMKFKGI
ncbi:hypothetical protein P4493_06390 [Bacillus thuringiensis]|jgi:hypothetical protein|uniref:Uncharacterized protein n=3 Tax=Bacillus thuringiensis TaxID=1428 RepID=A0A0B5NCH4_BACTU|nr:MULTISPECIES: hypothetical protein [Bacillus]MEC2533192.1 hypothetical protein [Bacillus cereus]MED1153826.1 hypothetical protein [Bacillus paranthracis]OUB09317.1 hypothetical protein BK708_32845 [Bacillus thuringiensis serovar yunnanensis]AFQ30138.1 hypothetical protein BTF1_30187 [Bacillus thuringiensis HD-789]AJG74085.1 hypothetical protein BF38_5941 [Bacillus thuringiensis]